MGLQPTVFAERELDKHSLTMILLQGKDGLALKRCTRSPQKRCTGWKSLWLLGIGLSTLATMTGWRWGWDSKLFLTVHREATTPASSFWPGHGRKSVSTPNWSVPRPLLHPWRRPQSWPLPSMADWSHKSRQHELLSQVRPETRTWWSSTSCPGTWTRTRTTRRTVRTQRLSTPAPTGGNRIEFICKCDRPSKYIQIIIHIIRWGQGGSGNIWRRGGWWHAGVFNVVVRWQPASFFYRNLRNPNHSVLWVCKHVFVPYHRLHINRHAMLHGSANGSTDLLVWDSVDLFWFITDNSTKQLMAFSFSNTRLVNQI